ncbi:MAG: immunoglobulin domain-containing protein [Phycisphaerales bacterium]
MRRHCAALIGALLSLQSAALAQSCDEWSYFDPAPAVYARCLAFDAARSEFVAFSVLPRVFRSIPGEAFGIRDGVWTRTAMGPDLSTNEALRTSSVMACDEARGVMVLNSGSTWELVNGAWVLRTSGFIAATMTFDSTRGRIIAVGNDRTLREWNGASWTIVPTSGQVLSTARTYPLIHDPVRNEVWSISDAGYTVLANGAWGPLNPGRWDGADRALVGYFDPVDQRVHVITRLAEYRWTGTGWAQTPISGWPASVLSTSVSGAWDPVRREAMVLNTAANLPFGGVRSLVLRAGSWVPSVTMGVLPIGNSSDRGLVYDTSKDRLIGLLPQGTVELRDRSARVIDGRRVRPLGYDPGRDIVLGELGSQVYTMSDRTWMMRTAPAQLLIGGAATYDPLRQKLIGVNRGTLLSFDGSRWNAEGSTFVIETWQDSWIAFDPVRGRSVLMVSSTGGGGPTRHEMNGQIPPIIVTPQVANYGLEAVYDPNRGGLVTVGGWRGPDGSGFPRATSILRSNAAQWEPLVPRLQVGRKQYGAAYDTLRQQIVIWGGLSEGDSGNWAGTMPAMLGYGPAAIVRQPSASTVLLGQTTELRVVAKGGGQVQYRWRKDGIEIRDTARRLGTAREVLTIDDAQPEDSGSYDVVVSNPCGTETSVSVTVGLCMADINLDGGIDSDDTIAFFAAWEAGAGDFDGDGDTDGDDVIAFVARWDAGC